MCLGWKYVDLSSVCKWIIVCIIIGIKLKFCSYGMLFGKERWNKGWRYGRVELDDIVCRKNHVASDIEKRHGQGMSRTLITL